MLNVDYRALISRADLIYQLPAEHPVQGQPIGNGRMGTMVWTTPGAIHFQINRSDVFAVDKRHAGSYADAADYCSACAQVTLEVGGTPFAAGDGFAQRLSLYEAECALVGDDLSARCFVSAAETLSAPTDVLAVEIDDRRANPQSIRLTLSMWRPPEVRVADHLARYAFANDTSSIHGDQHDRILLTQQFTEGEHYCASTVAAGVVGSETQLEASEERARALILPAAAGKRTVLLASAASWSRDEDTGIKALALLDAAARQPYAALRAAHTRWWEEFWGGAFLHLHSEDGLADFMERVRTLHLYYMASTSRGLFPPKWNGSLFTTDGDQRAWGAQFWVWTTEMHYYALLAADAADLCEPFFRMYRRQLEACQQAAAQRWGVSGAFYPETTSFDGPMVLPQDVVEEFRAVFLGHRPATTLSARLRELCRYEHHLHTQLYPLENRSANHITYISHVASSACELAVQAWWRYRYTGDVQWLRACAYPLLREAVEFYRGLAVRAEDGYYHLHALNQHEDFWAANDGIWDLSAIRGTAPLAIAAAEILGVDADLRLAWQELLDHLAPYPLGREPQAQALTGGVLADDVWAAGYLGEVDGQHNPEDVWLAPVFPFEDWTLETRDPATDAIVRKLIELAPRMRSILQGDSCNTTIRTPIAAARAGRGADLPALLAAYYMAFGPLSNGWSLFEGHGKIENQAHSIEPLGCIATILQEGLLQSVSPRPGQGEIINVFPAWPQAWDASFQLLARGGFLVSSAMRDGQVKFVEIESRLGEECRLRNPWSASCTLSQVGGATQHLDDDILQFNTEPGSRYRLLPIGRPEPMSIRISPQPATQPASYLLTLPNGTIAHATLGRSQ